MCAGSYWTSDLQNIGTGTTGQVLTSAGSPLPSWTTPTTNNLLQFDCSLFKNYNMFTGQTYLLSSLFNIVYVDQTNTPSTLVIVLPNIGNGNFMHIQGCGTHNTSYSLTIAPFGLGGIRIHP